MGAPLRANLMLSELECKRTGVLQAGMGGWLLHWTLRWQRAAMEAIQPHSWRDL